MTSSPKACLGEGGGIVTGIPCKCISTNGRFPLMVGGYSRITKLLPCNYIRIRFHAFGHRNIRRRAVCGVQQNEGYPAFWYSGRISGLDAKPDIGYPYIPDILSLQIRIHASGHRYIRRGNVWDGLWKRENCPYTAPSKFIYEFFWDKIKILYVQNYLWFWLTMNHLIYIKNLVFSCDLT